MKQIIAKIIYKVTIITLVFGFLIQTISMFPFYVFASNEETLNEIEINSVNNVDESDVRLLYEVEDMKDEYLKVFRRTDGKLEYAYYDEMVNYFDGEKYVEVDALYKEESNEYSQSVNKYSVKLPKKLQDSKKIKLSFNNSSSIEITYNDISKVEGNVIKKTSKSDRIDELKNISGSVLYNNIFNNVDLLIESSGTKFKENIILNEYISNFSFSYNIKLKSLSLLKEDNIYKFINEEGTIVYEISPYFMWDSNMTYSEDISLVVEEVKKDEYRFTVTPSNEYLSKATYPVTIDPVVSYNASSSSDSVIKIKTIQKGFNNCSVNSYLQLTKYINEVEGVKENLGYYGIMEVDLTEIPLLEYVDSSFIRLHCIESNTTENALVTRIYTHSYSDINGNTSYNKLSSSVEIEKANDNYYTLDFTNFYNTNKNSVCVYEISPEKFIYNESTQIFSNHLTNSNVPVLNLISFDYAGLSSNRTYESVSAGDAGVINIDNALGGSNLAIPVYSNSYLNLTHYYSQFSLNNNMFGNKMNISLYEKLTVINNTSLCYTNGTGYKEFFSLDTETNIYRSEDGNSSTIKIEDSKYYYRFDSIEKEFNLNGKLLKTTLNYDNPDEHLRKEINYITSNNNILNSVVTDDTKIIFNYKTLNSKNILDYVIIQRLINGDFDDYIIIVYSYDAHYNVINNIIVCII